MLLFERVGRSYREITGREWALLSLETIGVIAGILIAFELDEWASRRAEAAKHQRLMERLFEETEFDVAYLRGWRDLVRKEIDREKQFAAALAKGQCPPAKEWDAAASHGKMPAVTPPTSVYQELTGAGGLSSVGSREIRLSLAEFHGNLAWTQQQVAYFRDRHVPTVAPADPRVKLHFDPTQDEPEVWTFDRESLCADQGFKNRVAAATRAHLVYGHYLDDITDRAIEMCAALGESLGKTCMAGKGGGGPLKADDAKLAGKAVARMRSSSD